MYVCSSKMTKLYYTYNLFGICQSYAWSRHLKGELISSDVTNKIKF